MITFVGGSKFAKGGPNPLANMDSWGSIFASRFGPGGPYPLADLDRGVQIQGGPNPLGHRYPFIERFHSRDQRPHLFNETKQFFCITKELNSRRTDLVHQYGRHFIV